MTQDEAKFIQEKKLADEFYEFKRQMMAKGVLSCHVQLFASKKGYNAQTIYRKLKRVKDHERRTGDNAVAESNA